MENDRFDALTRTFASRRSALGGLLGGLAAVLGFTQPEEADAHNFPPLPQDQGRAAPPRLRAPSQSPQPDAPIHPAPVRPPMLGG